MSVIYLQQRDITAAKNMATAALKLDPRDVVALTMLGEVSVAANNFPAAESHFRLAITTNQDYSPALRGLAKLLSATQRWGEAVKIYERAIKLAPQDVELQQTLRATQQQLK